MECPSTIFEPYPFRVGERIKRRRKGKLEDWEVIAVDNETVTVRCPFHGLELTWKRNCFWSAAEPGSAQTE